MNVAGRNVKERRQWYASKIRVCRAFVRSFVRCCAEGESELNEREVGERERKGWKKDAKTANDGERWTTPGTGERERERE